MTPVRLGLRENLGQFTLLVIVNAFVGAMVGMERTIEVAVGLVAAITFGSGVVVAVRMREPLPSVLRPLPIRK